MLKPEQLEFYSKKREKRNYEFRIWLKNNADPDELDRRFHELHIELFSQYDCSRCRNCCKKYRGTIPQEDLERDAEYLNLSVEELKKLYLEEKPASDGTGYNTKNIPCDFLEENGDCLLGDCKPSACSLYPYTNQPGRMGSLLFFLDSVAVCPVAYEICERLKRHYHFR